MFQDYQGRGKYHVHDRLIKEKIMKQYKIFAGLGGGFGGAQEIGVYEFSDEDSAMEHAFMEACETYESYSGMHGLRSICDIMEEDECDEDHALNVYNEERESWLDFYVEEVV